MSSGKVIADLSREVVLPASPVVLSLGPIRVPDHTQLFTHVFCDVDVTFTVSFSNDGINYAVVTVASFSPAPAAGGLLEARVSGMWVRVEVQNDTVGVGNLVTSTYGSALKF